MPRSSKPCKWKKPRYALRVTAMAMILTGLGLLARQGEVSTPTDGRADAQPPGAAPPQVGYLVRVPLPIEGDSDRRVRTQIRRVLESKKENAAPPVIVLEFGKSEEETGEGTEFGHALALAQYLLGEELGGARTVAYIPQRLEGHALLPAMACQEIVMHDDAELGRAGSTGVPVGKVEREAYEDVYSKRQTLPAAVAVGMIDPAAEVLEAEVQGGKRWILANQLPEVEKLPGFAGYETEIEKGKIGYFNADQLREHGFISRKVSDRADLASALKLSKLSDDAKLASEWNAIQLDIRGPINEKLVSQTLKGLQDRTSFAESEGRPINFICLWIDSAGGSPADSISLINYLSDDVDRGQVHVAAYIPSMARSDAAMIAMSCDSISIGPRATLGGDGEAVLLRNDVKDLVSRAKGIAKARGTHWSLWAAMIDRKLEVRQYAREGTGQVAYFCEEELNEQRNSDQWQRGGIISDAGSLLMLSGERADELGLVDHVTNNFNQFQDDFDLPAPPEVIKRNWAHIFIEQLRNNCFLPFFLVMIGTSALLTELSQPGVGLPGFIALICFTLYFWLAFMEGSATGLEILLFLVGIACIAAELFIIPGFGIFGIGGVALVIVSIVLASQTWTIPRTTYQIEQLPYSLFMVVGAGLGVFIGILFVRRFVDSAPGLKSIMLAPPDQQEQEEVGRREALANFAHLHGKRGTAITQLTPSGKAQFGDELVHVMSQGEIVAKGTDVIVVEVQGNVVIVESVS